MNAPTLMEWLQWLASFALLGAIVTGVAGLLTKATSNPFIQQGIWRGAFLLLLFGGFGEACGMFQIVQTWRVTTPTETINWQVSVGIPQPPPESTSVSPILENELLQEHSALTKANAWSTYRTWMPAWVFLLGLIAGIVHWAVIRCVLFWAISKATLQRPGQNQGSIEGGIQPGFKVGNCRIYLCPFNIGPLMFGIWRPSILLPVDFFSKYSEPERNMILAHEWAHVRNRDSVWRSVIQWITLLYWWHPMIRWARSQSILTSEFAADARVVEFNFDRNQLAECLVKFGKHLRIKPALIQSRMNASAFDSQLGKRIQRLLNGPRDSSAPGILTRMGFPAVLILVSFMVYFASTRVALSGWLGSATPIGTLLLQPNSDSLPTLDQTNTLSPGKEPVLQSPQEVTPIPESTLTPENPSDQPKSESVETNDKSSEEKPMIKERYTRTFLVPNLMQQLRSLLSVSASTDSASDTPNQKLLRDFIQNLGVTIGADDSTPNPSAGQGDHNAIYYNINNGILFVRATMTELEIIEQALMVINHPPLQVSIEATLIEFSQSAVDGLSSEHRDFIFSNVDASPSANYRVLNKAEYLSLIKALRDTTHADLISSPKLTTLSGRSGEIKIVDIKSIVYPNESDRSSEGSADLNKDKSNEEEDKPFHVKSEEIGLILGMTPTVDSGRQQIELDVSLLLREFQGYDDPSNSAAQQSSRKKTDSVPLPRFRNRTIDTVASIPDHHILMLGPLTDTTIQQFKSKVPLLGDIPIIGSLFRSEKSSTDKRNLIVFLQATTIDPAGNRIFENVSPESDNPSSTQTPR